MKWSWKLGTFAGIAVHIHVTFLLLMTWIGVSHWLQYRSVIPTVAGLGFVLAVFLCVVLHEYGHALMARRFGIGTRDITLLPIGGIARLERLPDKPSQEFWVALAGPAVNVIIAAVLGMYLWGTGHFEPLTALGVTHGVVLERLLFANMFLVGFNLIPAFPMDGGRLLRAVLAKRMDYARATGIAAGIGQGIAFVFAFLGLFTNPFLLFIALFVWIGAAQEAAIVKVKAVLGDALVRDAAISEFRTVSAGDDMSHPVRLLVRGSQQDFPVIENGRVVGMLFRRDIITTLAEGRSNSTVSRSMRLDFPVTGPDDRLEGALTAMRLADFDTVPVLEHGMLVGLLTRENVAEYLMVTAALASAAKKEDTKQGDAVAQQLAA